MAGLLEGEWGSWDGIILCSGNAVWVAGTCMLQQLLTLALPSAAGMATGCGLGGATSWTACCACTAWTCCPQLSLQVSCPAGPAAAI